MLELIRNNHLIYSADGIDKESLEEFERVADALVDFEAAGLIEIQSRLKRNCEWPGTCNFYRCQSIDR